MQIKNNLRTKEAGELTYWYIANDKKEVWTKDGWRGEKNKDVSKFENWYDAEKQVKEIRLQENKNRISDLAALIKHAVDTRRYDETEMLEAIVVAFGKETVLSYVKDNASNEELMDEEDMVQELTERGYNVIKTTSLKEQMELEDWVARQYPKMNMRENLFLQY